ncbi:MAG: hypothetical protein Q9190_006011 [Brigantiaea leucoxantha]
MSDSSQPIPPRPQGSTFETKYEENDIVWYFRNKKWRRGKVLKGESSNTRYVIGDDTDKEQTYHLAVDKIAKVTDENLPKVE